MVTMAESLVREFQLAQEQIAQLADQYDTAAYAFADYSLSAAFEAIRKYKPRNANELIILTTFYLDLLERTDQGDGRSIIACLRATLLEAIDRLVSEPLLGSNRQ
jgi:CRP-like cAMP-binding protein